jgi:hypothetical protein
MVKTFALILLLQFWPDAALLPAAGAAIEQDAPAGRVILSDAGRHLILRLNYDGRCVLDQVSVGGRQVVSNDTGVCSAIKTGGQWFTTRAGIPTPKVTATADTLTVTGVRFGGGGMEVSEDWRFTVQPDRILWRIDRTYHAAGTVEDTCFPGWDFRDMSTWTGALLGDGGVVWCKLFDKPIFVDSFIVRDCRPFAINVQGRTLEYFHGSNQNSALAITPSTGERLELALEAWPEEASAQRAWSESCRKGGATARQVVSGLTPNTSYRLSRNKNPAELLRADAAGRLKFSCKFSHTGTQNFTLKPD